MSIISNLFTKENTYKWLTAGATLCATMAVTSALRNGWRTVKNTEPPENPVSPNTKFRDALIWSIASGITVSVARMIAIKGASEGWKKVTGEAPVPQQA